MLSAMHNTIFDAFYKICQDIFKHGSRDFAILSQTFFSKAAGVRGLFT